MHQQLPKDIDPVRFAHNGLYLQGQIPLSSMRRLTELLVSSDGEVAVEMQFDIDETGLPFMRGRFKTSVQLECERCLSPMTLVLDLQSLLGIVRFEHAVEGLAEQYEPWVLDDAKTVNPADVVEDELILALPIVPKHDFACLPDEHWQAGETEIEVEKPASPFAVLAALKTKK
ncbi:hypothetical protein Q7C_2677 [Methylophaga frappieri]|jgi:uncharacterized protein|uniref:Large ribosomal RNA subunit accumulation protein YceD n=1 Tax=Methylophaga frappieri (strain ATCC BAA-2434 / DSM 25690 / JAM7) TaxID=754477 RepID=I1YLK4_METFJ|nr:YceD family protein [Methylophaga frappieri]AFJ03797.1 hypothetical protein Q7C_2677 [Methylophaga frappieri]